MSTNAIKEAEKTFHEMDLKRLPKELRRNSLDYYYLSVYPSLLEMADLREDQPLSYPDLITSAYLHIPYCSGVCDFCSYFLKTLVSPSEIGDYLELVKKEIEIHRKKTDLEISYLYVGGGTPSLIPTDTLESFLSDLRKKDILGDKLFGTLELHPEFFEDMNNARSFIGVLKSHGISRVSIGYQSSSKSVLESTNRRHGKNFLQEAVAFLKEEGMLINLDLMYGLPQLSTESWEVTLQDAIAQNPDSISTYFLFVTKGTAYRQQVNNGHITLPQHRRIQVQHILSQKMLENAGYFELPNDFFAKVYGDPTTFQQTNLPSDSKSLPLGAGSYGYFNQVQFYNQFSFKKYRSSILAGESPAWRGAILDTHSSLRRDVMFSFKNSPHLARQLFWDKYGVDIVSSFEPLFEYLSNYNLVIIDKDKISLTRKGRLVVEEIAMLFRDPGIKAEDIRKLPISDQNKLEKHNFSPTYPQMKK